ncbi:MAG: diacylglycerol kinase family lipid kinase [Acidobacteria bacterium]|nr:MAG: diacylglycerol kinase family lipid kinase [Acidobacteriota bacterium]
MRAVIIINPVAGGRARGLTAADRVGLARRALEQTGTAGEVVLTERRGHARGLSVEAVRSGCDVVVAWGGDGTINEVGAGVIASPAALGVVRAGSGNGMARELGIPVDPQAALRVALAGDERLVDAGRFQGRTFFNVAGIGFDAWMAGCFDSLGGERRGLARYTIATFRRGFTYPAAEYLLDVDGERLETRALVLAIANFRQYGGNVIVAPPARPDDGLLDLVAVGPRGAASRLLLVPRLYGGTLHLASGVLVRRARRITVTTAEPAPSHVDGEPMPPAVRIEAEVLPGALRVRVPGGRARL